MTFEQIINAIETTLNRLACTGMVDGKDAQRVVAPTLLAHADALAGIGTLVARDLAGTFKAVAGCPASEQDKLEAALAVLERVTGRGSRAGEDVPAPDVPAPSGAPVVDELASLRGDPEIAELFITEAIDHLGTIEAALLSLEEHPYDVGLLDDIFRPFHTIKGNAGALGLMSVQEVAHRVENLLDLARSGGHRMGALEVDLVLRAVDVLTLMLADIGKRLEGHPPAALDDTTLALVESVERAIAGGGPLSAADADTVVVAMDPCAPARDLAPTRRFDDMRGQTAIKVDTRKLDDLVDAVGELIVVQALIQEDLALSSLVDGKLARTLGKLKRISAELQRGAIGLRMVPVRHAFQKVARVVHDLSRNTGKPVELVLSGEDTELDRRVVEGITDPLMHMVRNSMDHGIEPAGERAASGKRMRGRLTLMAYHQGGHVVLEIADDGAGLNTETIRQKAVERGLINESATPSADEIHRLIFVPGFSTADTVTEISGRGVGMDVVRRNIEALRGRIEIRTERGTGTTFLIKLPLTLAVLDGLLVGAGGERFVLPANAVRESLRPTPAQVRSVAGAPRMVQVRESLLPLVFLGELFGMAHIEDPSRATVVLIEEDGTQIGLVVDELMGRQEVVIKSLGETFSSVRGVAGGAILGDGRIGLILDAHGIVGLMRGERRAAGGAMSELQTPITGEFCSADLAGKYLIFALSDDEYGLPVRKVREIVKMMSITAVPQVPGYVRGVINLRGKVVPIVDLRLKLGLASLDYTERTCIIVVEFELSTGPVMMGIIVDHVSEVLSITPEEIEPTPDLGARVATAFVKGIAKVKGRVKILLDLDRVLGADGTVALPRVA